MQRKSGIHHNGHYQVSYDDLIAKHESLKGLIHKSPTHPHHMVLNAILLGANELILRQDEMGIDFTIAIVTLLDAVSEEVPQKSKNQ